MQRVPGHDIDSFNISVIFSLKVTIYTSVKTSPACSLDYTDREPRGFFLQHSQEEDNGVLIWSKYVNLWLDNTRSILANIDQELLRSVYHDLSELNNFMLIR